jgi:hypothetical protein
VDIALEKGLEKTFEVLAQDTTLDDKQKHIIGTFSKARSR